MTNVDLVQKTEENLNPDYDFTNSQIQKLAEIEEDNVQGIAATQIGLLDDYHKRVLSQAKYSFRVALIAASVGALFFLGVILHLLQDERNSDLALAGTIGGALIEVIAGLNFYLYGKTAEQMAEFQSRLDKTQRFLLANSICSSLGSDLKDKTRASLVKEIAGIMTQETEVSLVEES